MSVAGRRQVKSKAGGPRRPKDYIRGNSGYNAAKPAELHANSGRTRLADLMLRVERPVMVRVHLSCSFWPDTACPAVFLDEFHDIRFGFGIALEEGANLFARRLVLSLDRMLDGEAAPFSFRLEWLEVAVTGRSGLS